MSFLEYEYWRVRPGCEERHDEMIRRWFDFLTTYQAELFPEWKSARYYRQTDRDGNATGVYLMLFEYQSVAAHHAYKERRKDWSGPYAEYKLIDPYQFFEQETVVTEYWQPLEAGRWPEFPATAGPSGAT